jgi:hypothetical protein
MHARDCRGGHEVPDLDRRAQQGARTDEWRPDHRSIARAYGSSGHEAFSVCADVGKARAGRGCRGERGLERARTGARRRGADAHGATRSGMDPMRCAPVRLRFTPKV